MLRTFAERQTRGLVLKKHFPPRFGSVPLYVTPEAGLKYLIHPIAQADPQLLDLVDEWVTPGAIVWDIGANVGLFSIAAAAKATTSGQVLSVEPDAWLVTLLERSGFAQPTTSAPVDVICAAVAERIGLRTFLIAERARATNALEGYGSTQTGGVRQKKTVLTVTMDWLSEHYPPPQLIKIDVEGAELEVLRGGLKLLRSARPVIIAEISNRETVLEIGHLLQELGYQLFDADYPQSKRQPLPTAAYNTLAIPDTRLRSTTV